MACTRIRCFPAGDRSASSGASSGAMPSTSSRTRAQVAIVASSASAPALLVLDDLHWADPASLAIVEELLTILPDLKVALLATYRSNWSHGWEGRSCYEQINIRPLRPDDARRMATELATGASMSEEIAERVLERSGGNPLFLEELVHGERGATPDHAHRLPASIHEMLLARLDALPADARRVLQLA